MCHVSWTARPDVSSTFRRLLPALPILALLAALPAHAQWTRQSPLPTFLDVRGVAAPTPDRVFLATADDATDASGALFESADGGATWVQRPVPASLGEDLSGIFFLDTQLGWAWGNTNVRTTDGGTTWSELPPLGSTYSMTFHTPAFGIAVGNFGLAVSRDGGVTWSPSPNDLFGFDFAGAQAGLGVSAQGVFRTTDGGLTFAPVLAGDAKAVAYLSSQVAVAIVDGQHARSTDGGATWTTGGSAQGRTHLTPVSGDVVLAWGRSGDFPDFDDRVLRSGDGGLTWTDLGAVLDSDWTASGFAFTVPAPPVVVATNGKGDLFRSTDAGLTWGRVFTSPGPRPGFFGSAAPVFADAQVGWFGFGPGFVVRTGDGGATWSPVSSGTGSSLSDVARFPGGGLIAVGDAGTVVSGSGADGSRWRLHDAFTTAGIAAVQVVGPQDAVAVNDSGRVYRSADGGETWSAGAATPPAFAAYDLHFSSLLEGWVIGSGFAGGAFFRTADGGDTWTPVEDFLGTWIAVDFEGASGWAANVGGAFRRTTDGGVTWTADLLPGSSSWITDLEFFDANIGYAVGHYGYAARTGDGGATWQVLPVADAGHDYTDIHLLGANELWLATRQGVACHSATGGQSWSVLAVGPAGFGGDEAITGVPGGDAWTVGGHGAIHHFIGPPPAPANQSPAASFDFQATGLAVTFTDTSVDPDGTIVGWTWDFGDGNGSTEPSPSHVYAAANTYIVRLTVTDDDEATHSAVRFIVVQPGPGGTFGEFTEVTPLDPVFVTPQDEDFWVVTTAAADYDGDGDLDVAVLGYDVVYDASVVQRLVLVRNDGPAGPVEWEFGYVDVPLGTLSAGASDLAWGDPDGDGDPDLAVGSDGATVIFRNDAGTLVLTDTVLPGYLEDNDQADFDLRSITWADYDNDGDADLLVPSAFDEATFETTTALLRNDGPNGTGGWTFAVNDSVLAPAPHAQSSWADDDGDQDLDLLLVSLAPLTGEGFIRRYRNDGDGGFTGQDLLGGITVEHGEAQWGDYDADGDLDLLVAGNLKDPDDTYTTALRVYRNDAGTYVPVEVIACVPCEGWFDLTAATWADYDSDGDVDILLAGTWNSGSQIEGRAKVYDNVGGVFVDSGNQLPAPRASGSRGGTFTWLDLDGDGDLDYFIAGQYFVPGGNGLVEAQMHVYRNDAEGANAAPSAPANLDSAVDPATGSVTLAWNPANDDLTPAAALTYDLVLFRGGVPVVTPRYAPGPGGLGTTSAWILGGLPAGSYTWALRAVDSAYNGGPTAQGAFQVGGTVPVDPLPRAFAFGAGFPNPFTGTTSFRLALPEPVPVRLDIFDPAGRRVARLADEPRGAGVHVLRWDATNLPGGVYFVRLTAGAFRRTQRIVHIR
jgi:photosystem II stability/assembly factor-like uncharacterized protein